MRRRGGDASPQNNSSNGQVEIKSNSNIQNDYTSGNEYSSITIVEQVFLLGLKDQQGYLSFLNDTISYILRGCIIMELAFRGKIRTMKETPRKHPAERALEVMDPNPIGDTLLDEALKHIKSEKHSIAGWIDLLSGETWNPMKSHFQLRQVRERVAKGLVDKGILRTDMKSFMLFDMATHPLSDSNAKRTIITKILDVLIGTKQSNPDIKTIALIASALAGNVLNSTLGQLSFSQKDAARSKAENLLREYCYEDHSHNDIVSGVLTVFLRMDNLLY